MTAKCGQSLDQLIVRMDEPGALAALQDRLDAGEDPSALLAECRTGMERVGRLYEEGVGSGGRRNDGCEPISWILEGKRLARTTIEARSHGVEIGLSVDRQIGLLREVLA